MQVYDEKCFENPIKIITSFCEKDFKNALDDAEKFSKTHYVLGYIRYEAKEVFFKRKIISNFPLLYFEVYKDYKKYNPNKPLNIFLRIENDIRYKTYSSAFKKQKIILLWQ